MLGADAAAQGIHDVIDDRCEPRALREEFVWRPVLRLAQVEVYIAVADVTERDDTYTGHLPGNGSFGIADEVADIDHGNRNVMLQTCTFFFL